MQNRTKVGKYRILFELGRGTYLVNHAKDKKNYCLKLLEHSKDSERAICREIKALKRVDHHSGIIHLRRTLMLDDGERRFVGLVMELMTVDLKQYLELKKGALKERHCKMLAAQIIEAVNHCHAHRVVHNDLKLENVMVDPARRRAKLIDFGLAEVLSREDEMHSLREVQGTPMYFSPEKMRNEGFSGVASDTWAVGVILHIMLFGRFPFHKRTLKELKQSVLEDELWFEEGAPELACGLLRGLLEKDPAKRLSLQDAIQHDWFKHDT